jgi:hypothetical protein
LPPKLSSQDLGSLRQLLDVHAGEVRAKMRGGGHRPNTALNCCAGHGHSFFHVIRPVVDPREQVSVDVDQAGHGFRRLKLSG